MLSPPIMDDSMRKQLFQITKQQAEEQSYALYLNVCCIIAESWDDIKVQQIIGRIRVNKQNPQDIEVLIPDYSLTDLGSISAGLYLKIREFENAIDNLDWTIARAVHDCTKPCPYGYYSPINQKTYANNMGLDRLRNLRSYIDRLREEEKNILTHSSIISFPYMVKGTTKTNYA